MHRPSSLSAAILSASQWDILDFEDIEGEVTSKLTDDDINAILKSISARDVLKRLNYVDVLTLRDTDSALYEIVLYWSRLILVLQESMTTYI